MTHILAQNTALTEPFGTFKAKVSPRKGLIDICFFDGKKLAAGIALDIREDKVVLEAIQTQPAYRRKGLARELHRRSVQAAHDLGLRLEGTERRSSALHEVWDKLKEQREEMELDAPAVAPRETAPLPETLSPA